MSSSTAQLRGPAGHPLLGHALGLSREALGYLQRCAREYGDLVPLRFFWRPILFVNHPDLIGRVLSANARQVHKDIFQRADRALIGNGLFLSEGDFWLRQRRLMQPAFHRERIAAYGETMVAQTERLLAAWRDGETRDVYRDMSRLTMGIVASALFDADLWEDADEVAEALDVALACLNARVRSVEALLPDSLPTPTNLRLRAARRRLDRVVARIVAARRRSGEQRGDLLSVLLAVRDEDGAGLTDRQVRDEVATMLVGGYETAADLLAWAWYLLSQHSAVEARLVAELEAVLGGRAPTVADVPNLPYTGHVVAETLRLYPPAPALGREAVADFDLGGYRVARGTDLFVSQWVIQRDSRYFPNPERFEPDRWADDLAERLPRYAYFPFGAGPRRCIGAAFATLEATLILATVAPRFRLALAPGHPVVAEQIPTLRPRYGLRMVVHRRERAGAPAPQSVAVGPAR